MKTHIFVLCVVLGLATGQDGDRCTCGNTACCQNSYTSASPYFFNINYQYNQQFTNGPQYGLRKKVPCLKVEPIPVSLTQLSRLQPVYTRIVDDIDSYRKIDNICTTVFPAEDDSTTFITYNSIVYSDGSNKVTNTIGTDVGTGTYRLGNDNMVVTQRIFATVGNLYIECNREEFGESEFPSILVFTVGNVSPIEGNQIQKIQNVIECASQSGYDLKVLPYRLPTRCVIQQVCSLTNPFFLPTVSS